MTTLDIPINAKEKLKCIVCQNYLSVFPVFIETVDNGGAVCGRCNPPRERQYIRDEAYERIAKFFVFPCRYMGEKGCKESLTPLQLETHEKICVYRVLDCPTKCYLNCKWQGVHTELEYHFKELHSHLLMIDGRFELNFNNCPEEISLLPLDNELFIVKKNVDALADNVLFSVQQIRIGDNPKNYKYFLKLTMGDLTYSTKFPTDTTCTIGKTIEINRKWVTEKLYNPESIIVDIEIINADREEFEEEEVTTSKARKKAVDWECLSELECPVCCEFMLPPIYQCLNGHSICCDCKPKVFYKCPMCKSDIKDTQNYTLEKMTECLIYPCKFYKSGCTYKDKSTRITKHEEVCPYSPFMCPLEKCRWRATNSEFIAHVSSYHESSLLKSDIIQVLFNTDEKSESYHLIIYYEKVFKVLYKYEDKRFYWTVQLVGPGCDYKKFEFEVDIIDNHRKKLKRYSKSCCIPLGKDVDSFAHRYNYYIMMTYEELQPLVVNNILSYRVDILNY